MKKTITISLIFFISTISIIGQTVYEPIIDIKNDTVYKISEDIPFTGNYREYYPGDIKVKGQFINGLKNGEFIYYNNNLGVLEYGYCPIDSIVNYNKGLKDGIQKKFFLCPQEFSRINFKNGQLDGTSYYWDESGQLARIENYKNNKLIDYKEINIDSNIASIVISIEGFNSDTLYSDVLLNIDTLKLQVIANHYSEKGHSKLLLKNYRVKSFVWSSYRPGSDFSYRVKGNTFPEKVTKLIKRISEKKEPWKFYIDNIIIVDKNDVEYYLKNFRFWLN